MASAEATSPAPNMSPGELECMRERKWWCFLLSSIFTFLAGLFIILIWRALAFLCCRKEKAGAYSPGAPKQPTAKKAAPGAADAKRKGGEGAAEIGFMTEAKDWAGELISGQTTTGRILVRFTPLHAPPLGTERLHSRSHSQCRRSWTAFECSNVKQNNLT